MVCWYVHTRGKDRGCTARPPGQYNGISAYATITSPPKIIRVYQYRLLGIATYHTAWMVVMRYVMRNNWLATYLLRSLFPALLLSAQRAVARKINSKLVHQIFTRNQVSGYPKPWSKQADRGEPGEHRASQITWAYHAIHIILIILLIVRICITLLIWMYIQHGRKIIY